MMTTFNHFDFFTSLSKESTSKYYDEMPMEVDSITEDQERNWLVKIVECEKKFGQRSVMEPFTEVDKYTRLETRMGLFFFATQHLLLKMSRIWCTRSARVTNDLISEYSTRASYAYSHLINNTPRQKSTILYVFSEMRSFIENSTKISKAFRVPRGNMDAKEKACLTEQISKDRKTFQLLMQNKMSGITKCEFDKLIAICEEN